MPKDYECLILCLFIFTIFINKLSFEFFNSQNFGRIELYISETLSYCHGIFILESSLQHYYSMINQFEELDIESKFD